MPTSPSASPDTRSSSSTSQESSSSTSSPGQVTCPCDAGAAEGRVHSLESFALVDGPGVRYAVFLSGCPMRCQYCHNPDTWHAHGQIYTAKELFRKVYRYKDYWQPQGGITVSGGEPMLQIPFVTAFFTLAKEKGVHTALDTSGQPYKEDVAFLSKFDRLMDVTDLVLLDIKAMDEVLHRRLTGHTNQNILAMARRLSALGKEMWIRHVFVPGVTGSDGELSRLRAFADSLQTVSRVEVLPYHNLGEAKWKELGITYPLAGTRTPTAQEIAHAEEILGVERFEK